MRILALETSGLGGQIALLEQDRVIREASLPSGLRTAQTLVPVISRELALIHWKPTQLELIAVTCGPGSFTGLRIGVTTAKVLAYATRADVLGLNTLEVIAAQASDSASITAVLDAQRQQLFSASFARPSSSTLARQRPTQVVDLDSWLAELAPGDLVTGPGLALVNDRLPSHVRVAPSAQWEPCAATVGQLAWQAWNAGERHDLWSLSPQYFRPSAAEEKK